MTFSHFGGVADSTVWRSTRVKKDCSNTGRRAGALLLVFGDEENVV